MGMSLYERFLQKVSKKEDGCWLWTGAIKENGYGAFQWTGRGGYAHRYSYTHHKGPIPYNYVVCHKCDIRNCVNPEHLFTGTQSENLQDSISKGRFTRGKNTNWPESMRRKEHHWQKINIAEIPSIKERLLEGEKVKKIADEYEVSYLCIYQIKTGVRWAHVHV